MVSKDGEIKLLLKEKKEGGFYFSLMTIKRVLDKAMYEKLESERDLLDMEIKTYQRILEDEEKRVQASIKLSKVSGGKGGVSRYSSESESEEELAANRWWVREQLHQVGGHPGQQEGEGGLHLLLHHHQLQVGQGPAAPWFPFRSSRK